MFLIFLHVCYLQFGEEKVYIFIFVMFQNICIVVGHPGSEFPSRRSPTVSWHVVLQILFAFLLSNILAFHGGSSLLHGLESEAFLPLPPVLPWHSPSPAVVVLLPNLARCRCSELSAKAQPSHLLVKREHLYCTAFASTVRLTCTANPILLQSLSVVLPLATSLL